MPRRCRGAVGPHELELTETSLAERTPYSELRTPLADVRRVASEGQRTFDCAGPATGSVIAHQAVSGVTWRRFSRNSYADV